MQVKVGRNQKETEVGKLETGDVFIYDDEYFLKTDEKDDDNDYLCVNLHTGVIHYFNRSDECTLVSAEVTIF